MKEKERSSHYRSNCINVPKFTNVLRIVVLTVVRTASTYLNSSDAFKGNKERSFRFAQTASISLNSAELSEFTSLRDIEKPPVLVALIGRLL